MTSPNIINVKKYNLITKSNTFITTNVSNVLVNPNNSNNVLRVNSIVIQNVSTSGRGANISLGYIDYNRANTNVRLIPRIFLAANTFVNFLDYNSPINLEEGDILEANVDSINNICIVISYELISDQL